MPLRPQRTRRTKVYDCNYDIGERYYKPVVDDLDRKYTGRSNADSGLGSLRAALDEAEGSLGASARRAARERERERDASAVDDLESSVVSRRRPASALMDEFDSILESRGSRAAAAAGSSRSALTVEDGEEESTPTSRLRAARARAQAIEDEFASSISSSVSNRKAKIGLDYSEKEILEF